MTEHFNELTPAKAERLALLAEECGECVQAIGKILRHGYGSKNPFDPDRRTNLENLEKEIADVFVAIRLLTLARDVSDARINYLSDAKFENVKAYLHHQEMVT